MNDTVLIAEVDLNQDKEPTGKTRHVVGGTEMQPPSRLRIVSCVNDSGYYLLYLDQHSAELTDTFHATLAEAYRQAEWEFGVKAADWQSLAN